MRTPIRRPALLALALTLALAAPAAANPSTTSETLTVQSQITMTGVPAASSLGSALGGSTLSYTFDVTLSTNNPTGAKFNASATDLTRSGSPAATIAAQGNRAYKIGASAKVTYDVAAGTAKTVSNFTGAVATVTLPVLAELTVPAAAVPGTYAGSTTYSLVQNP